MILSDSDIMVYLAGGGLVIDPFDTSRLQPASVDLLLGFQFKLLRANSHGKIDPKLPAEYQEIDRSENPHLPFSLISGEVALGTTIERFRFPAGLVGRLEGKSSLARIGLLIHSTAGFVDPGFGGHVTLELINASRYPILLYPTMPIAQMSFHVLSRPALRPYGHPQLGSKYVGKQADGAVGSLGHLNFSEDQ
jgi:dCTP deaminase